MPLPFEGDPALLGRLLSGTSPTRGCKERLSPPASLGPPGPTFFDTIDPEIAQRCGGEVTDGIEAAGAGARSVPRPDRRG